MGGSDALLRPVKEVPCTGFEREAMADRGSTFLIVDRFQPRCWILVRNKGDGGRVRIHLRRSERKKNGNPSAKGSRRKSPGLNHIADINKKLIMCELHCHYYQRCAYLRAMYHISSSRTYEGFAEVKASLLIRLYSDK